MPLNLERLARFNSIPLRPGAHESNEFEPQLCAVEAYNWLTDRPHSDQHRSATLGAFMRAWNDGFFTDADRELLRPLVIELAEANGSLVVTDQAEQIRGLMCADWYCRVYTPAWLDAGGLGSHADALRSSAPITSWEHVTTDIKPLLVAARIAACSAARSSARSAAEGAALSAAWNAAGSAAGAAWSAAGSAAGAAGAAWSAALSAAWNAARSAAEGAFQAALAPTARVLQESAADLVRRMIGVS